MLCSTKDHHGINQFTSSNGYKLINVYLVFAKANLI